MKITSLLTVCLTLCLLHTGVDCWGINSTVEFEDKHIPPSKYLKGFRYEYSERNTSEAYEYWDEAGVKWIEWPGNITKLDLNFPILKWKKARAKFIQNPCNQFLGMNLFAYAYKHLHLTYGAYRITTSYCPPLSIPRKFLPESKSKAVFILVSDFEFVSNELLVIIENQYIIRVGPLESCYRREGVLIDHSNLLSYKMSNGITSEINKLVTQNCCNKYETCKTGDIVLAYKERSVNFIVFVSTDSGINFKTLQLLKHSSILHGVLSFPTLNKIIVFHGNNTIIRMDTFSIENGTHFKSNTTSINNNNSINIKGKFQGAKFGQEISFLIWDQCRIWYSFDAGKSIIETNVYMNSNIKKITKNKKNKHSISLKHCYLGHESAFAYDQTGKIGLIDSNNHFLYGIDTKSSTFSLIVTKLDLTLMTHGTENSIVPHFDFNNRPKLMYPPKFLRVIHHAVQHKDYVKRLAIKLFPKSIFPSDFMRPFYTEYIPEQYKYLGFEKCESSGLSADSSITQKPKIYTTSENKPLDFIIQFSSTSNSSTQLKFEPSFYSKYLKFKYYVLDFVKMGYSKWYYFKYRITVEPQPSTLKGINYRINFFTKKSIRCVHQPQLTTWINVIENTNNTGPNYNKDTIHKVSTSNNYINGYSDGINLDNNPLKISKCDPLIRTVGVNRNK